MTSSSPTPHHFVAGLVRRPFLIAIATLAAAGIVMSSSAHAAPAQAAPPAGQSSTNGGVVLQPVVVKYNSSKSVVLEGMPVGATSVTLTIRAAGAWQSTFVDAWVGARGPSTKVLVTGPKGPTTASVTLPLHAGHDSTVGLYSSSASVRLSTTATYYVPEAPPVVTPPIPPTDVTPPPVVVTPPPIAVTPIPVQPGPDNTGVPSGVVLQPVTGDIRITTPGTVLDALDVRGTVYVDAPDVTIRNSIIRGPDSGQGNTLVVATLGAPNLVITDSEFSPTVRSGYTNGILGSNFRLTRVDVHDAIDSVHIAGDNVIVENSWLHDNLYFTSDPNQGYTPSHDDSIQIVSGSNIVIRDNTIAGSKNSGVQITQDRGAVKNVVFSGNLADGGGCTFNISEKGGGPIAGVVIADNIFGRSTKVSDCAIIAPPRSQPAASGNVYSDGVPVKVRKGA